MDLEAVKSRLIADRNKYLAAETTIKHKTMASWEERLRAEYYRGKYDEADDLLRLIQEGV